MGNKKERAKEIKGMIDSLKGSIAFYRRNIADLKREQDFIRGHYDKTWEEEYGSESVQNANNNDYKSWEDEGEEASS